MNSLFEAAKEISGFMASRQWSYCIIGGLAVQLWAEPRTTLDVNLTLLTGLGKEEYFVSSIFEHFHPWIADARNLALTQRILLIHASNGRPVDISLGALPFESEMIRRAIHFEFAPEVRLPCCTAEDLFIMKAFASRPRDWLDAENIVVRQTNLDKKYILGQLKELCELKEAPDILDRASIILQERL